MKVSHPLMSAKPQAISVGNQLVSKGNSITVPYSSLKDYHFAQEKAGVIKIIKKGKNALVIKV